MRWNEDRANAAIRILSSGRYRSIDDALPELSQALGDAVTSDSLKNAFRRNNLEAPGFYLRHAIQPTPTLPQGEVGVSSLLGTNIQSDLSSVQEETERLRERYGSRAEAAYVRRLERQVGNREYLAQRLQESILSAFDANPIRLSQPRVKPRTFPGRRLITALVSDIHFGLNVDPREVPGGGYNWTIAARRMARLATEIAAWKEHHRDDTDLQVVLNGDIIAGRIHLDDAGIRPLTEQIHGATSILVNFIDYLQQHFPRIRVSALPGNHDRVQRDRQVSNRWDSHAHAIYLAIAYAFRSDPKITFDVPLTGDTTIDLPGGDALAFATHGDVQPTIANVGKSLDIKPMISALNRINASGEYKKPVRVILYGHYHQCMTLATGIGWIVVNGSGIGPDAYARNGCGIRGTEGSPCQLIFESVPGYPFGDSRGIQLREADNDATYDRVIATPDLERWVA